jgi:hypothetical protein
MSATAPTPAADPYAADAADRYVDTLRVLGAKAAALNTALVEADLAADASAPARTQTLTDLHRQLRAMAGLVNDALRGWPEPPPEPR